MERAFLSGAPFSLGAARAAWLNAAKCPGQDTGLKRMKKLCVLIVFLGAATAAPAEIFTWVDARGVRHYSDTSAANGAQRAELPGLQSADGNPQALKQLQQRAAEQRASRSRATRTPEIVSPRPEQTFRDGEGILPISVTIGGSATLRDSEQLTYYLDGSPIPQSPVTRTQLQLGNVPRGAHTLSAALLHAGREVERTAPVTFYMQPPSAISPLNSDPGDGDTEAPNASVAAPPAGNSAGAPGAPRSNIGTGGTGAPSAR